MNILVCLTRHFAGCGFYRLYQPHYHLAKNKLATVTLNSGLWKSESERMSDEEIKKFDLIVWHKGFFDIDDIKRAKELGVPTVVDFDDHWHLHPGHSLEALYKRDNTSVKLHKLLLEADYITCTTEDLADQIAYHNPNVEVFPNAMDMSYPGCKIVEKDEGVYRFGYLGGHFHKNDVELLRGLQEQMTMFLKGYQIRLFGFDGSSIYKWYGNILSSYGKSNNFRVYSGLDIWNYPQFYNLMDCSLVPLEDNRFNHYKSELKMIEAGFFKKAVIVSEVKPYTNIINEKNCLVSKTKDDWYQNCKRLVNNPNLGKDLGENLFDSVQRFDIENINKKRYKFYQDVCQEFNTVSSQRTGRMEVING